MLFLFKQKTAYEMRISDWSSDVCSSDLVDCAHAVGLLTEKLKQVRLQIIELQQLEAALEHTIDAHRRAELPASVRPDACPVIERAARERAQAREELRSEERRVGKESVSTCDSRREASNYKKKT